MKSDFKMIQGEYIELLKKISENYKKDCDSIIHKLDQAIAQFEQKIKNKEKNKKK